MRGVFLSEGLGEVLNVLRLSPDRARLSWSYTTLQSEIRSELAPLLVRRSPPVL
jgi:hypothetical protein